MTHDLEDRLVWTLSLGMVSQGVSARQARVQGLTPWSGSLVAPALPCCYHCVLDLGQWPLLGSFQQSLSGALKCHLLLA